MTEAISAARKLACARRELELRRRAYPRWVEQGRLTQERAAEEIRAMEAIVADMEALAEKERLL